MRLQAVAAAARTRRCRVGSFLLTTLGTVLLLLLKGTEGSRVVQQMLRMLSFLLVILRAVLDGCQRGRMVQEMLVRFLLLLEIVDWILIHVSKSQNDNNVS